MYVFIRDSGVRQTEVIFLPWALSRPLSLIVHFIGLLIPYHLPASIAFSSSPLLSMEVGIKDLRDRNPIKGQTGWREAKDWEESHMKFPF